jgi:hypothetical protein
VVFGTGIGLSQGFPFSPLNLAQVRLVGVLAQECLDQRMASSDWPDSSSPRARARSRSVSAGTTSLTSPLSLASDAGIMRPVRHHSSATRAGQLREEVRAGQLGNEPHLHEDEADARVLTGDANVAERE